MTKAYPYFLVLTFSIAPIYSVSQTEDKPMGERICLRCVNPASNRCSGCKKVYYCSRACQLEDWKAGHKKNCKKFKKMTTAVFMTHQMMQDKDLKQAPIYCPLPLLVTTKNIQILCRDILQSRSIHPNQVTCFTDSFIQNPALKSLLRQRIKDMILFNRLSHEQVVDYTKTTKMLEKHPWLPSVDSLCYPENLIKVLDHHNTDKTIDIARATASLACKRQDSMHEKDFAASAIFYLRYMDAPDFDPNGFSTLIISPESRQSFSQYFFDTTKYAWDPQTIHSMATRSLFGFPNKNQRNDLITTFLLFDKLTQHLDFKPDNYEAFGANLIQTLHNCICKKVYNKSAWANAFLLRYSKRALANLLRNPYTALCTIKAIGQYHEMVKIKMQTEEKVPIEALNVILRVPFSQNFEKILEKAASYYSSTQRFDELGEKLISGFCKKAVAHHHIDIRKDIITIIQPYAIGMVKVIEGKAKDVCSMYNQYKELCSKVREKPGYTPTEPTNQFWWTRDKQSTEYVITKKYKSELIKYLKTSCTYCLMPLPFTKVKCCKDTYCSEVCKWQDITHEEQANCTKNNVSMPTTILLPMLAALLKV